MTNRLITLLNGEEGRMALKEFAGVYLRMP
jgi:hypothetical protein